VRNRHAVTHQVKLLGISKRGDCGLADLNTELQELAVDAGRTPQWVGAVHLPDQITNFAIY